MMISQIKLSYTEIVWFGIDINGNVFDMYFSGSW